LISGPSLLLPDRSYRSPEGRNYPDLDDLGSWAIGVVVLVFVFGLFPYLTSGKFEHATAIETMKRTFEITINYDPHHYSFG
jgi:hypothetical protein